MRDMCSFGLEMRGLGISEPFGELHVRTLCTSDVGGLQTRLRGVRLTSLMQRHVRYMYRYFLNLPGLNTVSYALIGIFMGMAPSLGIGQDPPPPQSSSLKAVQTVTAEAAYVSLLG